MASDSDAIDTDVRFDRGLGTCGDRGTSRSVFFRLGQQCSGF